MDYIVLEREVIRGLLFCRTQSFYENSFKNLESSYFQDKKNKEVFEKIGECCWKENRSVPSLSFLKDLLGEDYQIYDKVDDIEVEEGKYSSCVTQLWRYYSIREALEQGIDLFKEGKLEDVYDTFKYLVEKKSLKEEKKVQRVDWVKGWQDRKIRRRKEDSCIATGLYDYVNNFDAVLGGGVRQGELAVLLGHLKVGKSHLLGHIAYEALLQDKKVLYIVLEGSLELTERRFDARVLDTASAELRRMENFKQEEIEGFDGIFTSLSNLGIKLTLVQGRLYTISTEDIRKELELFYKENGVYPDMVIVDYSDIMLPTVKQGSETRDLVQIFADLKNLALDYDIVVWTASQADVSSKKEVKSGKGILTWVDMAGSKMRVAMVDLLVTIYQSVEEQLGNLLKVRLDVARDNPSNIEIVVRTVFSKAKILRGDEGG